MFAGLGSSVAVLLAVAAVSAVVGVGDESTTQLAAGGPPPTVGPAFLPATGGAVFAVDAPSTTVEAQATTTIATAGPTTTVAEVVQPTVPVPTSAPAAPPTTVAPPGEPRCSADQMEPTVTLSAPSYRPGESVVAHATLRNRSGAPCYYYSYSVSQGFRDASGGAVAPTSAMIADAFQATPLAPGQTLTSPPQWDQKICGSDPACPQAPPGTYTVFVSWSFDGPPIEATANFQLVP